MESRKCTESTQEGNPCRRPPMAGTDPLTCNIHTHPMTKARLAMNAIEVEVVDTAKATGILPRDFNQEARIDYAILIRKLVHANTILLQDIWAVMEEVEATRTAASLEDNWNVLVQWRATTSTIFKLIQTAATLDPSVADDDHLAAGERGVEALLAAMADAVLPGTPCPACLGTGRTVERQALSPPLAPEAL